MSKVVVPMVIPASCEKCVFRVVKYWLALTVAIERIVEQLEEVEKIMTSPVNKDCFGEECRASDCTVCLISKAIEIVKGGGVDAKTDS